MSHRDGVLALVCWFVSLPLQLWGGVGGPPAATVVGVGAFILGLVLFTAWAAAGGMPPMYRY